MGVGRRRRKSFRGEKKAAAIERLFLLQTIKKMADLQFGRNHSVSRSNTYRAEVS